MEMGPQIPNFDVSKCLRVQAFALDRSRSHGQDTVSLFRFQSKQHSGKLQFVCSDMWQAYLEMTAKKVPHVLHGLDRFHGMQKMSKVIDKVRAAEARQMKEDGYEPLLTGSR